MDDDEKQIDVTKLKYVMYLRKSTDDPKRQVRSLPDQKDECEALARRVGLNVVETIEEEKSAKIAGERKKFSTMLEGLRDKKYDAILAWNPDRLARNMPEGSEILDMVDKEVVKDLKFVTHYFTNNASGKMLLGMSFVMADYYSGNLSENVTRGVRRGLNEGKSSGTPKHGYVRAEDGHYRPDGNNFELICKTWEMRKAGEALEVIAQYMNDHDYARVYKENAEKAGQKVLMTDKILSARVFPDPFYYGILIQKGKRIDLRGVPGYDFQPTTDETTYNYVQSLTGRRVVKDRKRKVFKPLVGMVICAYCKNVMYPQTPTSGREDKTKILSYVCQRDYCPRKNKDLKLSQSVRAKVIFNFMYEMLENFTVTRPDYDALTKRLTAFNATKLQELAVQIHSKQGALKSVEREIKDLSLKIIKLDPSSEVYKANDAHITDLGIQRNDLAADIAKLQEQSTDPEQDVMTFEDFLNVANNASLHLRAADVGAKDRIARIIYLNVTVDSQKVVDYQIREPFATYFKMHKILHGRAHVLQTEPFVIEKLRKVLEQLQ